MKDNKPVPSRPNRDLNVLALLGLVAILVILMISGIAMYVVYQHPALAQPLTVAAGVAAALLTAVGLTLTRR
ncbi:hypothetical protein [Streptomyces humi]